ncbi:Linear gramicidin synthase subunit D [uncultured Roseburia sp.]|uniref:Thioester reductase domain-containing protein n=1 Tax=Brotonthovivens ammoniilytica TaxID=2981725 RepID=A0ABT2THY0_9FIRM|nr:thioester reductase domain-containing protein [Brotonthovivens ammoniilytica]MCU6761815.1 thioester reductase domain-containing protein [Brotonthovivens ammoniilytica]SCI47532.1 Linear gramicidin synthase subunit D [uncultured Roseburia sp.]
MNNLDNNIISILKQRYLNQPERVLYRFLTYHNSKCSMEDHTIKDIYETSLRMAYTLKSKGLKKGDRAVIFSMQDFGTICAALGCMMTGVIFTIIPPPLDDGKIERFIAVLKSCRPKALISNYELEKTSNVNITSRLIREAFLQVIGLKRIYTDKLLPYIKPEIITRVYPDDLVYLQYTSGSTSSPKGVCVTQRALMKNMEQCKYVYNFDYSTLGTWVPYFHNLGLVITIFMPICTEHATIYNLQTLQFLENPKLWIKMLSDYKLTLTVGPGSAYDACTKIFTPKEAAQYDLSHMTHLMNGSEYVSPKTIADFSKLFHVQPHAFAPGYGLAENVCLASVASLDYRVLNLDYEAFKNNKIILADKEDPNPKQIVGLGAAVKDLTMIACNPKTCRAYKDLKIGEIFISGDSVADGYWDNAKESRKFHYKIEGYDGDFYKTGDLGFLKDGYLYLTGRIKEMLIVNGHNVYPSDLLLLIQQKIPALAMSAIGFFSYNDGQKEQVVACIESRPDIPFEERVSQINALISERFGFSFHDVVFVPLKSMPRTDNSKLQMLKARKLYLDGKLAMIYSSYQKRIAKLPAEPTLIDRSKEVADEILLQVKSVFDKVLNIDHYSLNQSFLELGGDSLTGFELVSKMEQKFKIKLDLRELLLDSSVSGVASYIRRMLSGAKGSGRTVNLAQECTLDSNIRPCREYDRTLSECRHLFLTGATGFLGAHLIQSFIQQYPHDHLTITCLVRAESEEEGKERIIRNMKHFHCWDDSYQQYLYAVTGDLSSPNLGLDTDIYAKLAAETDAIYHNGAVLNFVFPYEFLKSTNVNGTIETLRLACTGPAKYYHYVSSYSVYDTPDKTGKRVYENDPLTTSKGFSLAYSETKWVSEKLVGIAKNRGLRTVIYRPGDITGTRRGIWEVDDMVSRVIVGSIQMRSIPRSTYCMHMTPVDYVADAITCISRKPEALGEAFNIINPKPVSMKQLIMDIRQCGYPIRYIPFPVWRKRLRTADAEENSLAILECLFEAGTDANPGILRHFIGKDTTYDVSKTDLLLNGTDITCPQIDTEMIASYLRYFKKLGCI